MNSVRVGGCLVVVRLGRADRQAVADVAAAQGRTGLVQNLIREHGEARAEAYFQFVGQVAVVARDQHRPAARIRQRFDPGLTRGDHQHRTVWIRRPGIDERVAAPRRGRVEVDHQQQFELRALARRDARAPDEGPARVDDGGAAYDVDKRNRVALQAGHKGFGNRPRLLEELALRKLAGADFRAEVGLDNDRRSRPRDGAVGGGVAGSIESSAEEVQRGD